MIDWKLVLWTAVFGLLVLYGLVALLSHKARTPLASESLYDTNGPSKGKKQHNVEFTEAVELSVVIPCYNERERLGIMLDECVPYLEATYGKDYELVLVDDGSNDGTKDYALEYADEHGLMPGIMRVFTLEHNRGKGGAVTHGMKFCRGRYALFADADGASKFTDIEKLFAALKKYEQKERGAVAVGSRAYLVNTEAVVKRSFIRNFLMRCLHLLVWVFGVKKIKDTQCGFKLFNRRAVDAIFPYMHTERWIFDVEVLMIAFKKQFAVEEVSISWHEVSGSKIDIAWDSINMAIDLVVMRLAFIMGIYTAHKKTH
jgi:dolichyl-phosphate beta-glucosyltransferase